MLHPCPSDTPLRGGPMRYTPVHLTLLYALYPCPSDPPLRGVPMRYTPVHLPVVYPLVILQWKTLHRPNLMETLPTSLVTGRAITREGHTSCQQRQHLPVTIA